MTTSNKTDAAIHIPQKHPFVFVDHIYDLENHRWKASFVIPEEHVFLDGEEFLQSGLIEVMAQSVAAGMTLLNKDDTPRVGFIGEVKGFKLFRNVRKGDNLDISVEITNHVFGVLLIHGTIASNGQPVAEGDLKLVVQDR